jgi:hypothetical protein
MLNRPCFLLCNAHKRAALLSETLLGIQTFLVCLVFRNLVFIIYHNITPSAFYDATLRRRFASIFVRHVRG